MYQDIRVTVTTVLIAVLARSAKERDNASVCTEITLRSFL
jgi:hypothetical protein